MIDASESRTGRQIMFEGLNFRGQALGQSFDAAIRKILNIADDLMPRRRALREETIADTLHIAADVKAARDPVRIRKSI